MVLGRRREEVEDFRRKILSRDETPRIPMTAKWLVPEGPWTPMLEVLEVGLGLETVHASAGSSYGCWPVVDPAQVAHAEALVCTCSGDCQGEAVKNQTSMQ